MELVSLSYRRTALGSRYPVNKAGERSHFKLFRSSSGKSIIRHESMLSAFLARAFLAGGTIVRGGSRCEEMSLEELLLFLRRRCGGKQPIDAGLAVFGRFNHDGFSVMCSEEFQSIGSQALGGRAGSLRPTPLHHGHHNERTVFLFRRGRRQWKAMIEWPKDLAPLLSMIFRAAVI